MFVFFKSLLFHSSAFVRKAGLRVKINAGCGGSMAARNVHLSCHTCVSSHKGVAVLQRAHREQAWCHFPPSMRSYPRIDADRCDPTHGSRRCPHLSPARQTSSAQSHNGCRVRAVFAAQFSKAGGRYASIPSLATQEVWCRPLSVRQAGQFIHH